MPRRVGRRRNSRSPFRQEAGPVMQSKTGLWGIGTTAATTLNAVSLTGSRSTSSRLPFEL